MTINISSDPMLSFQRQMIAMNGLDLLQHLSIISDPRQQWKVEHKLSDILFLTIVAVIGGAEGWEEIEDFGVDHLDWLRQYGDFENGVPVHDTISRVMGMLSATQLQKSFATWMKECHVATAGEVIAIDGKTLRRSYDKGRRQGAIHMVSAFSAVNQVVLGQVKTDDKSNEITAIPELLELLSIRGCLVTINAMGCQRAIAQKVINKGADYLLAVKGNQPRLEEAFSCYISPTTLSAKELLEASRSHWSIESQLHWQLDVGMREDNCPCSRNKRREQAGEYMAVIRYIAFNALKTDASFKAKMKRKQKRANRNNAYL